MAVTYEPIAGTTLGAATSTVTLSSIPSTYTDLVLVFLYKGNTTNQPTLQLTFNATTTGYSGTQLVGNGTSAASYRNTSASYISVARSVGVPASTSGVGTILIDIMSYANTSIYKTILARAAASDTGVERDVGLWQNTAAINEIKITTATSNDFAIGSVVSLYGVKAQ